MFRRWTLVKLVYLDLGDGASKQVEKKPTETSFHFSQCPGQYLAESTTWHAVASLLAVFDVSPALDNNGKPIDVRYALNGVTGIIT
jgi:hypothetical protein